MFSLVVIIGIYSYIIFFLGLAGILHKNVIFGITIVFALILFYFKLKNRSTNFKKRRFRLEKIEYILIFIVLLQASVNLIGVFGPEISFDSLWYHLTLPKIYLINHSINFIPGNLLYYSAMPKLIEMLYVPALSLGSSIYPKLISFSFGILSLLAIFCISKKFLNKKYALLAVVIFYSNLVVGWESITSYVDLGRVFFELMALWAIINWIEERKRKWFYESAVMLGLAIATKLIAFFSLFIFLLIIIYYLYINKKNCFEIIKYVITFLIVTLFIPLPWFIFSFLATGNPFFPYFSKINFFSINYLLNIINPINYIKSFFELFLYSSDPISPIYLILIPLLFVYYKKTRLNEKILLIYFILGIFLSLILNTLGSYIVEIKGGTRFILSYLAAYSILISAIIYQQKDRVLKIVFLCIVLIISLVSIAYRGVANAKFIPVIFNNQSEGEFLSKNLNFNYGDFYDTDGYFKRNIGQEDTVLLYGFHNLYYINFPFIDSSWVKKGDSFNYIATQNTNLPDRFKNWKLVYQNLKTNVKLYSLYGLKWHY